MTSHMKEICITLSERASNILISTNDRYRVGVADGILEAVEKIERILPDYDELLVVLKNIVQIADRNTIEFNNAKIVINNVERNE